MIDENSLAVILRNAGWAVHSASIDTGCHIHKKLTLKEVGNGRLIFFPPILSLA